MNGTSCLRRSTSWAVAISCALVYSPVRAQEAATEETTPSPETPLEQPDEGSIEACFEAFEQSQVHMKDGELLDAMELAESCSKDCPEEITTECRALRSQIDRDVPTALLLARSEKGTDADDVAVLIDGNPHPSALGEELPLDPGPHSIVFSRDDGWQETVDIVVRRSEKRRQIRVIVPERSKEPLLLTEAPPVEPAPSVRPWAIGALSVGGAGFVTMAIAGIVALNRKANLEADCYPNLCPEGRVDERSRAIDDWLLVGDIGLAIGAVGVLSGTGLLIWDLTKPKDSTRASLTVMPTVGGASGMIRGHF